MILEDIVRRALFESVLETLMEDIGDGIAIWHRRARLGFPSSYISVISDLRGILRLIRAHPISALRFYL
jgi:hypothetical protein